MLMENPQIMLYEKVKRPSPTPDRKKLSRGKEMGKKEKNKYAKTKGRIPAQKKVRIQERR